MTTNFHRKPIWFAAAALVAGLALSAPAANARVSLGINLGMPVYAPPVYAPPPAYYAPPVVAYPQPYYPPAYYGRRPYPVRHHWYYDRYHHRHWR